MWYGQRQSWTVPGALHHPTTGQYTLSDKIANLSVDPVCLLLYVQLCKKVECCIYRELVFQRIHRHELFTPPSIGAAVEEGQNKFQVIVGIVGNPKLKNSHFDDGGFDLFVCCIYIFQLRTIEALLGSSAKVGEVIVFGMVTQLKEVTFHVVIGFF